MLKFFRKTLLRKGKTTNYLFYTFGENLLVVAGIPDEINDKILQPFFTTKKGTAGTGLGLSITNDIIKAHGGVLDIQTDQNDSIFSITLNA